jgi:hypothetical protein
VGNQLLLGESIGYLEVFDINNSKIMSTHKFSEADNYINDIIAIDDTNYLLATAGGLLHTSKDQLIKHYFEGKIAYSMSKITESIYLVGLYNLLIVCDQKTDQKLFQISKDSVVSIKRVMTTNNFIIKTVEEGVKLLSINDLKS